MKFKPVPDPPADLETVAAIHRTVPTDPERVDDCCGELVADAPVSTREAAATWLTFLRALELAEETADGFRRREPVDGLDADRLSRVFCERVYGVDTVLEVLAAADEPLSADEVSRRLTDRTERRGAARGTATGGAPGAPSGAPEERVDRLLEWAVLFDRLTRDGDRYRSR